MLFGKENERTGTKCKGSKQTFKIDRRDENTLSCCTFAKAHTTHARASEMEAARITSMHALSLLCDKVRTLFLSWAWCCVMIPFYCYRKLMFWITNMRSLSQSFFLRIFLCFSFCSSRDCCSSSVSIFLQCYSVSIHSYFLFAVMRVPDSLCDSLYAGFDFFPAFILSTS